MSVYTAQEIAERIELSIELTGAFTVGRIGQVMGIPGSAPLMEASAALVAELALVPALALPESAGPVVSMAAVKAAFASLWKASGSAAKKAAARPLRWALAAGIVTYAAGHYQTLTADERVRLEAVQVQRDGIAKAIDLLAAQCEGGNEEACRGLTTYLQEASAGLPVAPQAGWIWPLALLGGVVGLALLMRAGRGN